MSNLDSQAIAAAQTITTTTELDAGTASTQTNPVGENVVICGAINVTTGAATTAVTVRVRRGEGITGTVVGIAAVHTLAAAAVASIPFEAVDTAVPNDNQVYSVTIQQTAATGNGTVNGGVIKTQRANGNQ